MTRRSNLEIKMDLLTFIANNPDKGITNAMYFINTSWVKIHPCLSELVDRGLVEQRKEGSRLQYQTTAKAEKVVAAYRYVRTALDYWD